MSKMIKVIGLMKRKPELTHTEYRDYYEAVHRRIGERVLTGNACHYTRRYLTPQPDRHTGEVGEPAYDCILEIWYPDQAAYERSNQHLSQPDIRAEIEADEANLFDMPNCRFFTVDEVVSELG